MGADLVPDLSFSQRRQRSIDLLAEMGLEDHHGKLPSALSGGQCQRVAIARALAGSPRLLLADEPTAALDSRTVREVVELLKKPRIVRFGGTGGTRGPSNRRTLGGWDTPSLREPSP